MPYGMYISAEGAAAQSQRLEVIANNLANVDTAGFKQDVATFQARFAEAIQLGQAQAGDGSLNDIGGGVKMTRNLPWSISQDGFISQAGGILAIGMSQPASLDEMVKVGNNMYESLGPVKPLALEERNAKQGYLEMSGANPVRQMMAMIETTRAFEANTRMIQSQDSVTGSLINRVLQS